MREVMCGLKRDSRREDRITVTKNRIVFGCLD